MKYLIQMMIIGGITFLGEMLHVLIPLPVPASVYGMAILFVCLCLHIIREEHGFSTVESSINSYKPQKYKALIRMVARNQ